MHDGDGRRGDASYATRWVGRNLGSEGRHLGGADFNFSESNTVVLIFNFD